MCRQRHLSKCEVKTVCPAHCSGHSQQGYRGGRSGSPGFLESASRVRGFTASLLSVGCFPKGALRRQSVRFDTASVECVCVAATPVGFDSTVCFRICRIICVAFAYEIYRYAPFVESIGVHAHSGGRARAWSTVGAPSCGPPRAEVDSTDRCGSERRVSTTARAHRSLS